MLPQRTCCGTLLTWVWESAAAYEAQYADPELGYHQDAAVQLGLPPNHLRFAEHYRAAVCRMTWLLPRLGEGVRMLDVGSSKGALVAAARESGWLALGLEPNRVVADLAWREHAAPTVTGGWEQLGGTWDLITGTDVIEHLLDPLGFFQRARAHTQHLYLETPDWTPDVPGDWKHIKPREHPVLYSEAALIALAARAGWRLAESYRPIPGKLGVLFDPA